MFPGNTFYIDIFRKELLTDCSREVLFLWMEGKAMVVEKIDSKIKKKENRVKKIFNRKGIDFKKWYLEQLEIAIEDNLDEVLDSLG